MLSILISADWPNKRENQPSGGKKGMYRQQIRVAKLRGNCRESESDFIRKNLVH